MKAREVSVMVADFGNELYVNITLKLPGHSLGREACSPDGDATKGVRVSEASRKQKAKLLRKILESIEFPEG